MFLRSSFLAAKNNKTILINFSCFSLSMQIPPGGKINLYFHIRLSIWFILQYHNRRICSIMAKNVTYFSARRNFFAVAACICRNLGI